MRNLAGALFIFIFGLSLYVLTLKGVPGNIEISKIKGNLDQATKPLELSPERGRFLLTISLAQNESFSLRKDLAEAAAPDVGFHEGKFYIFFPPGISLMAVPFYQLGQQFNLSQLFSFGMVSLFATLNVVFLFLIARNILKLPLWASILAGLIFGFASPSWSYAVTLYQHHVTTFLILSSLYAVYLYRQKSKLSFLFSLYIWAAYGWGIWIDYPNAILLAPVMAFYLLSSVHINKIKNKFRIKWNATVLVGVMAWLLIVGLHGYYNYRHFGKWSKLSGGIMSWAEYQEKKSSKHATVSATLNEEAVHRNVVGFFTEENFPRGISILSGSRDRSLFLYAPIFFLALLGIFLSLRKINFEKGILIAIILSNVFLYSSWGDPWGGWAFGPRYLIPSMAIMSLFVAYGLVKVKYYVLSKVIALALFAYSSFIALLGVLTTNQVPPKIEADFLKMKYNFLLNWDYFIHGRSGSYIFNEYGSHHMTLSHYFIIIYSSILFVVFLLLFVVPLFSKKNES